MQNTAAVTLADMNNLRFSCIFVSPIWIVLQLSVSVFISTWVSRCLFSYKWQCESLIRGADNSRDSTFFYFTITVHFGVGGHKNKLKMKTLKVFAGLLIVACTVGFVACNPKSEPSSSAEDGVSTAHPFNISATKKIVFAPGNLQYQASTGKWRFAENQYDVIGKDNENVSKTYSGWIDLFGWGTGNNPTLRLSCAVFSNYYSNGWEKSYLTFTDWGINVIEDYPANTWRTLTLEEWTYLKKTHEYFRTTVSAVDGYVLLPDDFEWPDGLSTEKSFFTAVEWEKLESAGAVFFPDSYGLAPYSAGSCGASSVDSGYWLADAEDDKYGKVVWGSYGDKFYGHSVRLVKDVE